MTTDLASAATKARQALYELEDALDSKWSTRHPLDNAEFGALRQLSLRIENDTTMKIERACQEYEEANQPEGEDPNEGIEGPWFEGGPCGDQYDHQRGATGGWR